MSTPLRIFLRLLGVVLFAGSLAGVAVVIAVGPDQVGEHMSKACRRGGHTGPSEWCTWQDVLDILEALPFLTLVGAVLMFVMRVDWVGRDRDKDPVESVALQPGRGRFHTLGAVGVLAVVAIVVVNFAGVFIYRASYTVAHQVQMTKKILRHAPPPPDLSKKKAPAPAAAPRGLARGSLLRASTFRPAIAEIRRTAPAGARLSRLRVAPDRVDAEVLARGKAITLTKAWDSGATIESTTPATDSDTLLPWNRLDAAAPQRFAVAVGPRDVDYLVLQDVVDLRWRAFLAGGEQVTAPPDGRSLR
jgi:hypothetical protein